MASVNPFKGILYNTEKVDNLSNVVMPPFDVISEEEQGHAYERHPQNVIRLILNRTTESDTPENNPHTRAAGCFRQWLEDGILVQDMHPAIYLTALEFSNGHRTMTPIRVDRSGGPRTL